MPKTKLRKGLRLLEPLLGQWVHMGDSGLGKLTCNRRFNSMLDGHRVRLDAIWSYEDPKRSDYVELCIFGLNKDGILRFNSFVNDGTSSSGLIVKTDDLHGTAICFEAQMPHGLARQAYSPDDRGGWNWKVERKVKSGWSPIIEQAYRPDGNGL